MDDAFVARVDQELVGLDRILHANFDESTMQETSGFLSRLWFFVKQFRLGVALTIAVFVFLWMV
jgi:uncharacterized membrane protein (GlpM family)